MIPESANVFEPLLIKINLSFTYKLSELTNDAVPLTVKSPVTVKLLLNVELPVTVTPPAATLKPLVAPAPTCTWVPVSVMFVFAKPVPVHLETTLDDKAADPEIANVAAAEPSYDAMLPEIPVPKVNIWLRAPVNEPLNEPVRFEEAPVNWIEEAPVIVVPLSVRLESANAAPVHLEILLEFSVEAPDTATVAVVEPSYVKAVIPAPWVKSGRFDVPKKLPLKDPLNEPECDRFVAPVVATILPVPLIVWIPKVPFALPVTTPFNKLSTCKAERAALLPETMTFFQVAMFF